MRIFIIAAILIALAGCANDAPKPDANYAAYLDLVQKQQQATDDARTAFAQMATKCTSDACVTQVAAISALAASNARPNSPQPFVQQESLGAKIGLALVGQLSPLASAAVAWHQSDISKETVKAQYGFLGGVVHDVTGAVNGLAPSITVGGDYVTGTVDNGTHVGGDLTNGSKVTNSGFFNTGTIDRYQSPSNDPVTSGNGCAGSTTCQTAPADPPAPSTP
jgi:hypothetical protein